MKNSIAILAIWNYLDAIQKHVIRLLDDQTLWDSLDWLTQRRSVSFPIINYHDMCSDEIKSIIPPKICLEPSTPRPNWRRAKPHHWPTNTYISVTSMDWNSLSVFLFPVSYNINFYKTQLHSHLHLHPFYWSLSPLLFDIQRFFIQTFRCCIYLVSPFESLMVKLKKLLQFFMTSYSGADFEFHDGFYHR